MEKRGLLALYTLVCPLFVIPAYYLFFVPWFFFLPLLLFDETLSWWICWASENIRAVFVRNCSLGSYAMNKNISLGLFSGSIVRLLASRSFASFSGIYKWQLSQGTRNGIVSNFFWILAKFLPNCATNFSNERKNFDRHKICFSKSSKEFVI